MSDGLGPVSTLLKERVHGLLNQYPSVLWLDAEGAYTDFVDRLHQQGAEPILPFRGSWLEIMQRLDAQGTPIDRPRLLIHLPGYNAQSAPENPRSVRNTPLLAFHRNSHPFRLALTTLVTDAATGRISGKQLEDFLAEPGLTLAKADAWLEHLSHAPAESSASWIADLDAPGLVHHVIGDRDGKELAADQVPHLADRAEVLFGLPAEWRAQSGELAERLIAWLLCVEFVHDLRRPPNHEDLKPLNSLHKDHVRRCRDEAVRLRHSYADRYRGWAPAIEHWVREAENTDPRDFGHVDTFPFEADAIYKGAVRALGDGDYEQALEWFEAHEKSRDFWVQREQSRRWAWMLVGAAAKLGVALNRAPRPLEQVSGMEEALERYAADGAPVDRAHRALEQRYVSLNASLLHETTELEVGIRRLREEWGHWADRLNSDFANVCRTHGALPSPELQQRTVFDQAVLPLLRSGEKVALFLLDALRYEMALELREEFQGAGAQVDLRARYAELPTITAVGMNALAPIERDGRLTPVLEKDRFTSFRSGEAKVHNPATRLNAMRQRADVRPPLSQALAEIQQLPHATLKRSVAQAQLVVVHGLDLDEAGESGFGVRVFADILQDVVAAKRKLEAAGIRQFVFTSDHGFLLQRGARSAVHFENADRRYAYSATERNDAGNLCLSLQSLGYDAPGYLIVRENTAAYDTGRAPKEFVHGGNSLQERVIPVLHVSRKRVSSEKGLSWVIDTDPTLRESGVQRMRVRVRPDQARLEFANTQPVDVLLRVLGNAEVKPNVQEVSGDGASAIAGGARLRPSSTDWAEIFFTLEGPRAERVGLEVVLASDSSVRSEPGVTFPVSFVPPPKGRGETPVPVVADVTSSVKEPELPSASGQGWGAKLGDPDAGKVFDHIERFGSINEAELNQLLGSARKTRGFAARFDRYRDQLTFEVEITFGAGGKRYQRI